MELHLKARINLPADVLVRYRFESIVESVPTMFTKELGNSLPSSGLVDIASYVAAQTGVAPRNTNAFEPATLHDITDNKVTLPFFSAASA